MSIAQDRKKEHAVDIDTCGIHASTAATLHVVSSHATNNPQWLTSQTANTYG